MTVVIICLTVLVAIFVIILAILLYNQMLLYNEVNKRLLLMAKESIDKERSTHEELQEALQELQDKVNGEQTNTNLQEEPFNPHTYHDNDLDLT